MTLLHEQQKRVNNVMNYIVQDPSRSYSLDELASVANYSEFHFHRVFKRFAYQTPGQFILNQRLDRAARALAYNPGYKITEVAAAYGFSSNANFSKAFRPVFGMSPKDFRGNMKFLQSRFFPVPSTSKTRLPRQEILNLCWDFASRQLELNGSTAFNQFGITLRNAHDYRVAYMRKVGPYLPVYLDEISEQLMLWVATTNTKPLIIGVTSTHPSITRQNLCLYDICAVLPSGFTPPKNINTQIIKGGLTAVLQCKIDVEDFYHTFQTIQSWLTLNWMPVSGFQPDDRPNYEIYLDSPRYNNSDYYLVEMCVPVRSINESVCMI